MAVVRVELGFAPRPYQREAHALRLAFRFLVLVWHRRAGKTVFAIVELILAALACTRPLGRYGYIAPEKKQAKKAAWPYLKKFARAIPGAQINETELFVAFPNGARIEIDGADDPDSIRGAYFDGVVLDEVAQMKPSVWGEVIRPMLADRLGWAIFIGTPKGVNLFSELYFAALKGREGLKDDMRRAADTGAISAKELASAKGEMTPQEYAQEFECDFAAAVTNTMIPLKAVLDAQARRIGPREFDFAPKVLGIDVAREGDDRSCFFPRQGLVAFRPRVLREPNSMVLADQAAEYIDKWKPDAVFIDASPISAGVIDRLRQLGQTVIDVDFGGKPGKPRFENKRAEMWWQMAEWVKGNGCLPAAFPESQALVRDLTAPTYLFANDRGKLALEKKVEMKARGIPSPDLGDALALTFAAPVAIQTDLDRARAQRPVNLDSNPYS